jgi:tRNA A-37 threonylcarbamoyl transferase component Bud32
MQKGATLDQDHVLQDRYHIIKAVGGGGMGKVYLAHDTRLANKPCAVKELVPDRHATPKEREEAAVQFHREAAILGHLNHPHLPNVYDYFEERERFYLVMDYVEGENLSDRLAQSPGGLDQETVIEYAIQLCDVLEYLHSQTPPVIFRDMKPANVMIMPEGNVKLVDFGVARLFDPAKRTDTLKMGTAGYAPPEQYAGQGQTTPRSDIYALGATLHELLTGADPTAQPFVFTPPRTLRPGVSPSLSDIVMRALSLDPSDRFPSARAMREALEKATRPRRLRLPTIQRRGRTGTRIMAEPAATPLQQNRAVKIATGMLRWLGRIVLAVGITLFIAAIVLILAGTIALSRVVERAVASTDWGLVETANRRFTMSEDTLQESVSDFVELYALDAADDVSVDLRYPDELELSMRLFSCPVSLLAGLGENEGAPAVILKRVNDVPLYIVGGIVSGGINQGFQEAWKDSPLRVTSLTIRYDTLTVDLEPGR